MKRKMMMMAICVVAVMLAVSAPLAAQQSETNVATATTFETDADNYMDVNDYGDVSMNKWFALSDLNSGFLTLGYAKKLGGVYLGTFYRGYIIQQSSIPVTTNVETDNTLTSDVITSTKTTTTKETEVFDNGDYYYSTDKYTSNTAGVLLGLGKMGFKLGVSENSSSSPIPNINDTADAFDRVDLNNDGDYLDIGEDLKNSVDEINPDPAINEYVFISSTKIEDNGDKTSSIKEFSDMFDIDSSMTPNVKWGMNLNVGSMILKPNVMISVGLEKNTQGYTYNENHTINGSHYLDGTNPDITKTYLNKANWINPSIILGGTAVFAKKDIAQSSVGLKYTFNLPLVGDGFQQSVEYSSHEYWNDYDEVLNYSKKTDSEYTGMTNTIVPSYGLTMDLSDKVSVGMKAQVGVSIGSSKTSYDTVIVSTTTTNSYSQNLANNSVSTTTTTYPGDITEETNLVVNPDLNLGFTYKVKPGKFTINSGLSIQPPTFTTEKITTTRTGTYKQTVKTVNGLGEVQTDSVSYNDPSNNLGVDDPREESEVVTTSWSSLYSTLYFGTAFNFTENFVLEASTSLGTADTLSLFGTGGNSPLTNSLNLMFTIKF